MRIVLVVIIVLILGGMLIANALQTDFRNINSGIFFVKIYLKWIAQIAGNIKNLAIEAYNMDWLPKVEGIKDNQDVSDIITNQS
jgi:hypothetical protein